MITPEQTATLITNLDVTPNLPLILRRAGQGRPMSDITLSEIRDGIEVLKRAIQRWEPTLKIMTVRSFPGARALEQGPRRDLASAPGPLTSEEKPGSCLSQG